MTDILSTIAAARQYLDHEPGLAAYFVRDCRQTRDAGLDGAARQYAGGRCSRADAAWLLDALETHVRRDGHA